MKHSAATTILAPRITEKGAYLAEKNVYVFNVHKSATKQDVADAVREIYKVTPKMVRIAAMPTKRVFTRGTNRFGRTAGGKKAYVYLKAGDKIEIA